jgi:N-carbamoyl-L-amino-acid hydrolase
MAEAGLEVVIDPAANLIGRRPGSEAGAPALMAGSHIDTVPAGGRFDGAAGVLAALAAAEALDAAGARLRHPLEIVDFLAEEPTDLGISCVGSRGLAGELDAGDLARPDPEGGGTLADLVAAAGGRPRELDRPLRPAGAIAAYLELHIEQGPVLERRGVPIGVVTAIVGIARLAVSVVGRAGHSGTVPMADRRDALAGAAEIVLGVERLGREGEGDLATVGKIAAAPNAANAVPGRVDLVVELRAASSARLDAMADRVAGLARDVGGRRGLEAEVERLSRSDPSPMDPAVREAVRRAAAGRGLATLDLPSGAGHDALYVAAVAPAGMIFVPCRGGISHHPDEWSDPGDIARGAEVLADTLLALDQG